MSLGDVIDKLLDQHSLADTGTAKQSNLATTGVGGKKIDDLDSGLQDFGGGSLINKLGSLGVNRHEFVCLHRASLVDRFSNDIENATKNTVADGNLDGGASVD